MNDLKFFGSLVAVCAASVLLVLGVHGCTEPSGPATVERRPVVFVGCMVSPYNRHNARLSAEVVDVNDNWRHHYISLWIGHEYLTLKPAPPIHSTVTMIVNRRGVEVVSRELENPPCL